MLSDFFEIMHDPELRHKFIVEVVSLLLFLTASIGVLYLMGAAKLAGWY